MRPTAEEVCVPGALRAALPAAWLVAGLLTGCGGITGHLPASPVGPVGPAQAPLDGPAPAGVVVPLGSPATAVVVDPHSRMVALALIDPPRVRLVALDGGIALREMLLPGPAADLTLAAAGGPVLVAIRTPGVLIQLPLDGGAPSRTELPGAARGAVMVDGFTVVALGERIVVLQGDQVRSTISGFADATSVVAVVRSPAPKVGVLDRGRAAVSVVDVSSGKVSAALRAGNGAARAVADRFGRMLVTDVRDGELLAFAGDPPVLRQRFPLPGAPFALAYDGRRDLAWVTLTARNEVVGLAVAAGEPLVVHRFPTVRQPDAVAVDPASGRVVVVSASGAGLQFIDPERVVH